MAKGTKKPTVKQPKKVSMPKRAGKAAQTKPGVMRPPPAAGPAGGPPAMGGY